MGEAKRKRARDTALSEIFPGRHGPAQADAAEIMRRVLIVLRDTWPNHEFTLFVAERDVLDGTDRLPRFNYGSTAARDDMIAVLKAFIAKNEEMASVDRAMNAPPAGQA